MPTILHSDDDDPIDPLAARPDDPVFFQHRARLYDRPAPLTSLLRTPLTIIAMVGLTLSVALIFLLVARIAG